MALDFKSPICIYVPTNQPIFPLPILFRWDQIYQNLENLENGAALYRAVVRLNISGNIWDRVKSLFVSLSLSFCLCLCHYICLFCFVCHCHQLSLVAQLNITGNIWDRIKSERNRAKSPGILYPQILVSDTAKYIEAENKICRTIGKKYQNRHKSKKFLLKKKQFENIEQCSQ